MKLISKSIFNIKMSLMQTELFNNKVKQKKKLSKLELSLLRYDKRSFEERHIRLKYLNKIFPKGYGFAADMATVYIFDEVKMAFVNGEFISVILLSQAFIERILQIHFESIGLETISKKGLKAMIEHGRKNDAIPNFLIEKIDDLRKKRNPFVHLKDFQHEYNLNQRLYKNVEENLEFKQPMDILFEDAKAAISIMYGVFITRL